MTAFDIAVIGIVGLSTLLAFWQGFVRMAASLAAWVVGIVAAIHFSNVIGTLLPDFGESAAVRYVVAFAIILIVVLMAGAVVGFVVSRLVQAAGLGFVDRVLGAIAGLARGILVAVLVVLFAGLTTLPKSDWWQNAVSSPALVASALSLRPWLPKAWADRLDYSRRERPSAKSVVLTWLSGTMGG
ncbi:MAG TPA: CvpA family protein [Casimicrobiaceae bacterium]|nr:CvpA family protein [Casimicrobiaceae bacterium]